MSIFRTILRNNIKTSSVNYHLNESRKMANVKFTSAPGFGDMVNENMHYSQVAKMGDFLHGSGQGGWYQDVKDGIKFPDSLEDEIEQAFKNVDFILKQAGAKGWENVYNVRSYHSEWEGDAVSDAVDVHTTTMVKMYQKYCPNHKPTWTEVGVARLGLRRMRIEIEVQAYIGK